MQFYTNEECRAWMRGRGLGAGDWPTIEEARSPSVWGKLGHTPADTFRYSNLFNCDSTVLLWIVDTYVSQPSLHLYYRLRESYCDRRLVDDAPGHLFLNHEKNDLLSYIQICLHNGWDFWVLGAEDYARLFVSHDEYFEAATGDEVERRGLIEG